MFVRAKKSGAYEYLQLVPSPKTSVFRAADRNGSTGRVADKNSLS